VDSTKKKKMAYSEARGPLTDGMVGQKLLEKKRCLKKHTNMKKLAEKGLKCRGDIKSELR